MVLTEEQKERIRKNRERALELQKKRKLQQQQQQQQRDKPEQENESNNKKQKIKEKKQQQQEEEEETEKEDWEENASPFVFKKEAQQMYCLPEGTLAVCSFTEKENPRNKGFAPMKLYDRKDIRRRAHKRFGGVEGLKKERRSREEKRFQKDLERTQDIFRKE